MSYREQLHGIACRNLGIDVGYCSFGSVDTLDLLNPLEQELFEFYRRNEGRYSNVADIGANVGIHSLVMASCGWVVRAYEPDPVHFKSLLNNVDGIENIFPHAAAVSDANGKATFTRVIGNTTGSHLAGDKEPYGVLEHFEVDVVDVRSLVFDFAKIDCEGHEARIICSLKDVPDMMVEVGNSLNAKLIFDHVSRPMYSRKTGWKRVRTLGDMPSHHSEGMLFIGEYR